jgi:hypothetical protein
MNENVVEKKTIESGSITPEFVTIKEKGQERELFLDFAGLMPLHSPEGKMQRPNQSIP